MWRRLLFACLLLVPVAIIWAVVTLPSYMVGVHQQNVTQSLSDWKTEYSTIESQRNALRTAEMLEYIQGYYFPGEGYRSTPQIEEALQSQRQETIDAFVGSLREYTKQDFGRDSDMWLAFLQSSGEGDDGSP